jgi:ABC-type branched-subunit amino acid transport system ATPase component
MSSEHVLDVQSLSAGYDGAAVVRDLDLYADAGEVVALLGPNGAGKTTTLRAISGLIRPMAGAIQLNGLDLLRQSPPSRAQLGVAHVPEGRGIFFGLTVAEHFRLGHRGEHLDAKQQMLALGRALARRPKLLLLDEMSLGLAPIIVERLLPVVSSYAKQSGCAVVLVEQHIHIALAVADRGYVLSHGQLVIHEAAAKLRGDHQLILSGYLGEKGDDSTVH